MPIATAESFRNRSILVAVPGSTLQLECRRPDPLDLIADGILPLDVYAKVLEQLNELTQPNVIDNRGAKPDPSDDPKVFMDLVNRWVCAAVVTPKVVMTEEELSAVPDALWIAELDADLRLEIVRRTNTKLASPRVRAAVEEFRRLRPVGAAAGSDGAAVRGAAVSTAGGA